MPNLLLSSDSYKYFHYKIYPPKTTNIYSYFESRGGKWNNTCFFGLQYFLKEYLSGEVVTRNKISEAYDIIGQTFHDNNIFNFDGWKYILDKYHGKLPISIKAVSEGSIVGTSNILFSMENTDPNCAWLTNFLEALLVQIWYPISVSTQSREMKRILLKYLEKTGTPSDINFKLHDFGERGVSSMESAGIGGLAHLVHFQGTDTVPALKFGHKYYNYEMAGFSLPATEHSTVCSWGRENEAKMMEFAIDTVPTGLLALVCDSYDIYNVCENILGEQLHDKIMARNGTIIVRPDSSDPKTLIPQLLTILGNKFGFTTNSKDYKVLDPHIRMIWGDGINYDSLEPICKSIIAKGWSIDNIAFGSGGGLLQQLNRDTLKFAFKCSSAIVDGKQIEVYKDPVTDPGKRSKRGRLALIKTPNGYQTVPQDTVGPERDFLQEVFRDGVLLKEWTLDEIRERARLDKSTDI